MELHEVLAIAAEHLVQRLRPERATGAGLVPRTRDWLLLVDARGVIFDDFHEPYEDAHAVLNALIELAEVEAAALVTLHSGSELLLAVQLRKDGATESYVRRSHIVPGASRFDPVTLARWEAL
jgi:hypothetical protein